MKNIIFCTLQQVFNMLIPLITAPYLARVLGVEGIGVFSYTNSYMIYFWLLASLGTSTYGTREIAINRDDKEKRSKLFWEIEGLSVFTTIFSLCIWMLWILINSKYKLYYIILSISILAVMFDVSWFYAGMERFANVVVPNILLKVVNLLMIFIFVKDESDLWKYLLINSLSTILANMVMWFELYRYLTKVPFNSLQFRRHLRETLVYFIPTISTTIYTVLDKTLIGIITKDTIENGNYEQATKIINICKSISFTGFNMVFQSRMSSLFSKKRYEEIKKQIYVSMDYILFVGCGLCFAIIGISVNFVPMFFGYGYEKTIYLLIIMAPLTIIIGISNCLGFQYYNPAGLRSRSAKYIVIGSVVNLTFNIFLIPFIKSYGAAIASVIAEIVISFLYLLNCDKYYDLNCLVKQLYKKAIAGAVMGIVVFCVGLFAINEYLVEAIQVVVAVLVYILILIILRDNFMYRCKRFLVNKAKILSERENI